MKELRDLVQHFINDSLVPITVAKVKSVSKADNTCVVEVTGTEETYNDVRLMAIEGKVDNPTVMYPKVESMVVIAPLFGSKSEWAVLSITEVDEIYLNGSDFGGLVKADVLKKELDKTNATVTAIRNALLNWVVVPSDGGAALKSIVSATLPSVNVGNFESIKNDKVKHG